MFNHAPPDYVCPFCAIAQGSERAGVLTVPGDVVLRTDRVVAFVASHWWPRNRGHVLVVPLAHHENVYELPDELGAAVFATSKRIAIALKRAYGCDGVSTRQHNEPAGNQDVWHYHIHVFPRYAGDDLYAGEGHALAPVRQRAEFVARIRMAIPPV